VFVVSRNSETKDEYSTFVSKAIIEKLRKTSPNQKNSTNPTGIWNDWYVEMAQAKAIKKLAKMLPIGDSRAALALVADDKAEMGGRVDYSKTAETGIVIDIEATQEPKTKSRSVDSLVGGMSDAVTEVEVPKTEHQEESAQTMPIPELVLDNSGETAKSDDMSEPAKITPEYLNSHAEWRQKIMAWTSMSELTIGLNEMPKDIKTDLKDFLKARQDFIKANYQ
jgi:hypothetical protein